MVKKSAKMGNMHLETLPEEAGGSILSRFLFLLSLLLSLLFLAVVAVAGGLLWVFWTYGKDLPDYHQLAEYEPPVVTRIHAGDGALLAEFANQKRLFVPVEAIPLHLIHAFLSAEDSGFYSHFGIDPQAMLRAAITNAKNYGQGRRPIGASTITQQVTKNFLLTNEVSVERKSRRPSCPCGWSVPLPRTRSWNSI